MQFYNLLKKRLLICLLSNHLIGVFVITFFLLSFNLVKGQDLYVYSDYIINSDNEIQLCVHIKNNSNKASWLWMSKLSRESDKKNEICNYFFSHSIDDTLGISMPLYYQIIDINCNHDIQLFYSFVKRLEPNDQFDIFIGNYLGKLQISDLLYSIRNFSESEIYSLIPALSILSHDEFPFFNGKSIIISEYDILGQIDFTFGGIK